MTTENESPKVMFVISSSLSPDATRNEPVAWAVGQAHPVVPGMSIIGMFTVPGEGVEIYAASPARKGVRSFIPMHWIRYIHEEMSFAVFSDEFEAAVAGEPSAYTSTSDDDEDYDDPELEPEPVATQPPPPGAPNGQPTS